MAARVAPKTGSDDSVVFEIGVIGAQIGGPTNWTPVPDKPYVNIPELGRIGATVSQIAARVGLYALAGTLAGAVASGMLILLLL